MTNDDEYIPPDHVATIDIDEGGEWRLTIAVGHDDNQPDRPETVVLTADMPADPDDAITEADKLIAEFGWTHLWADLGAANWTNEAGENLTAELELHKQLRHPRVDIYQLPDGDDADTATEIRVLWTTENLDNGYFATVAGDKWEVYRDEQDNLYYAEIGDDTEHREGPFDTADAVLNEMFLNPDGY